MQLRLRQYKPCDADSIVSWIKDEEALRKWSADRFGDFPVTSEDINNKYYENNGDPYMSCTLCGYRRDM